MTVILISGWSKKLFNPIILSVKLSVVCKLKLVHSLVIGRNLVWFKLGFEVYGKGTLIKHKSILKHDKKFQHRANYWMFGSNAYTFFD